MLHNTGLPHLHVLTNGYDSFLRDCVLLRDINMYSCHDNTGRKESFSRSTMWNRDFMRNSVNRINYVDMVWCIGVVAIVVRFVLVRNRDEKGYKRAWRM